MNRLKSVFNQKYQFLYISNILIVNFLNLE